MINKVKTFKIFGYKVGKDKLFGHYKVVHECDCCGKERVIEYRRAKKKNYFCHPCLLKGENNYFHSHVLIGKANPHYIDGKTLKKHYCKYPNCKTEIGLDSVYGDGYCKKHSKLGPRNGRYIDGRTPLKQAIRALTESKEWSLNVFKKDKFTCQRCGATKVYFTAHHIKRFNILISEFLQKHKKLSPTKDRIKLLQLASKFKSFWNIKNGVTLCKDCHKHVHTKNR